MSESPFNASGWRERITLRRSARAKRIRLRIVPSGLVEVVVPKGFNAKHLPPLLDQHEAWVVQTLERLGTESHLYRVEAPEQITLPAIGKQWRVVYLAEDGGRYGCREKGDGLLQVSGGTHWQVAIRRWLLRMGHEYLVPWLEQVSRETDLSYRDVSIRLQRSRWGSCSASQRINLNAALLFLSPEQVRYLLLHELCHTREMNHSKAYWEIVASYQADYQERDRTLRRAVRQLPDWLHASLIIPAGRA